jgi:hypothetical protein
MRYYSQHHLKQDQNGENGENYYKKQLSQVQKSELENAFKLVPSEYFTEQYRLDKSIFKISTAEEAALLNDGLNKHLEIVESNLVKNISEHFDFFTNAFNNFDGMKEDLVVISEKAHSLKQCNQKLKE